MIRFLIAALFFSAGLSAQVFNRAKAYNLEGSQVQLEMMPNGNTVVSSFDGYDVHLNVWNDQGDSIQDLALPLSFKWLEVHRLKRLGSNRLLLSLTYRDACDLFTGLEHLDLLLDENLNILDSLIEIDQGQGVLYSGPISEFQDSTYLLSGGFGFQIVDYRNDQLSVLYDTLNYNALLEVYVLNADSILLLDQGLTGTQIFRFSDSTYFSNSFSPGSWFWDFDQEHFAQTNSPSATIDLIKKSDLSFAGSYTTPNSRTIYYSFYFGDTLLYVNDTNYTLVKLGSNQIIDTGVFQTYYFSVGFNSGFKVQGNRIAAAGYGRFTDIRLESLEIGQAQSYPFRGLQFEIEATNRLNFDVVVFNEGTDTVHKLGLGVRSGNTPYYCQNIWYRRIINGLQIEPGDSLRLTFAGDPFSSDTIGSAVAPYPVVAYMVNDLFLDRDEQTARSWSVISQPEMEQLNLEIYPNPVRDVLNLDLASFPETQVELRLYNLSGHCLLRVDIESRDQKRHQIDLQNYPAGVYILELNSDKHSFRERILKH